MGKKKNTKKPKISLPDGSLIDLIGYRPNATILPEKYFANHYNVLFNSYTLYATASVDDVIKILFLKFNLTNSAYIFKSELEKKGEDAIDYLNSSFLIEIKKGVLLFIDGNTYKIIYDVKINFSVIQEITRIIKNAEKSKTLISEFSMFIKNARGTFDLKPYKIKPQDIDLKTNYNDDFIPVHNVISKFLKNDDETGIVLLHGKYGTGKTHYLRYLISHCKKRFVFFPNDLIDAISSPNFLPFISEHKNCVVVLEDCDDLLKPRQVLTNKIDGIVNLLNMSDGLLGDALSIKVICTFNTNLKNIDQAILRKGRLIARYEFQELYTEKAKALSNKLGFKKELSEPMTLADVYNQEKENYADNYSQQKMGFKTK